MSAHRRTHRRCDETDRAGARQMPAGQPAGSRRLALAALGRSACAPRHRRPRRRRAAPAARRSRRIEIYGFAMLDIGHDFKQINPNWSDTMRVDQAAVVRRTSSARTAARSPACARAGSASSRRRRPTLGELKTTFEFELFGTGVDDGQTTFRLRHAYGELGPVRRRPDLEPVHGHRRVPELARVLGTDRHGVLPQRPGALDADPEATRSLTFALERPGASGDAGRLRRPHRAAEHQGAASRCPTSPARTSSAGLGLRSSRRHAARDQVGRHRSTTVRSVGRRHRLGHQLQLEHQARQERRRCGCRSSTARASRTT